MPWAQARMPPHGPLVSVPVSTAWLAGSLCHGRTLQLGLHYRPSGDQYHRPEDGFAIGPGMVLSPASFDRSRLVCGSFVQVPPGVRRFLQVPPGVRRFLQVPPGVRRYLQVPPGVRQFLTGPAWCAEVPVGPAWCAEVPVFLILDLLTQCLWLCFFHSSCQWPRMENAQPWAHPVTRPYPPGTVCKCISLPTRAWGCSPLALPFGAALCQTCALLPARLLWHCSRAGVLHWVHLWHATTTRGMSLTGGCTPLRRTSSALHVVSVRLGCAVRSHAAYQCISASCFLQCGDGASLPHHNLDIFCTVMCEARPTTYVQGLGRRASLGASSWGVACAMMMMMLHLLPPASTPGQYSFLPHTSHTLLVHLPADIFRAC